MKIVDILNKCECELDAKLILSNLLHIDKNELFLKNNENVPDIMVKEFFDCLKRRKIGEPISKIFNKRNFWKDEFFVNCNVLDPRNDSETLIEAVIENFQNKNEKLKILDLGSGSGCLSLSLLREFKNSTAIGIDINKNSIDVARFNAIELQLYKRIKFIQNNWVENFNEKFDIIISNPPYIKKNDIKNLSNDVKIFDPYIALNGGNDGLLCYRYLSQNIAKNCNKNCKIFLEIGINQLESVKNIFEKNNFTFLQSKKDLNKIDRIVVFDITNF